MTTRGVNGPWYALLMSEGPPERVVIRGVKPELECGRFPVKRVLGETVAVEADIFSYGHDALECVVRYRHEADEPWTEISMEALGNDHWRAEGYCRSDSRTVQYLVRNVSALLRDVQGL